jgi:hypothetical protein
MLNQTIFHLIIHSAVREYSKQNRNSFRFLKQQLFEFKIFIKK